MRKSAKKQQSQVQTIQITVTSRNVTQDNGNINKFWKGGRWFAVNAWGPIISYEQNQENGCLENYICVRAFKHRPVLTDQVFCNRCMLSLLQSWRFQLTALPGQAIRKERKTHSRFPLSRVLSYMHTFALTQMRRCV